jgi:peroxiredoxin Q/BCP
MVEEGSKAPAFTLPVSSGGKVKSADLKGKPIVVYFYPKDDTPGCTKEAIDFSEHVAEFERLGATIIGISPDSVAAHEKFIAKHELTIRLASDEEKKIAEKFGVWVEKSMYGRKYMGIERSTFLIDKKGKVAKIWRKVKVAGHANTVLTALAALATPDTAG